MSPVDTAVLALVLTLLATMPVFALRSRQRAPDADVAKRPATILVGFWMRNWFMWLLGPVERPLVRARVSPDLFNYLGLGFGIAAAVGFAINKLSMAGGMIALGGICDILDGRLARAIGAESGRGAFLDSTLDRYAEAATFIGVGWYFSDDQIMVCASMVAMGSSLLVSYARARGEALGVKSSGGVMQRAERLILLAVAAWLDGNAAHGLGWRPGTLLAIAVALIGLGSLGTAVYRTVTIAGDLRRRERGGP